MLLGACQADTGGGADVGRGSHGTVNIILWQAASTVNAYLSGGTKDIYAASLVTEPLAKYDPDGNMFPVLVDELPTQENGGVAADLMSITWTLTDGILWSDGTPLTAADVAFTGNYCLDPDMGCNALSSYADVESVEAVDDLTVKITFSKPKPFPYGPLVGATNPVIQKAQFEGCMGAKAQECTEENFGPVGTGPYVVDEFRANDVVTYKANDNFREAGKPYFSNVVIKGGGDAASAARAVLETGEADYAWNLQVEPEILAEMEAAGFGTVIAGFGTGVERLMINMTNPDPDLGDDRALYVDADGDNVADEPHPFLTDPAVCKALSLSIDRQTLVDVGYGFAGKATCNVLSGPTIYASTANDDCLTQDVDAAKKLLDDAGYVPGDDGVREKDGVRLSILYQTSTNSVRQGTQALLKQMWEEIGVETELKNIDSAVFFGGDPASPDTYGKFYADIEMYTNSFDGTDPEAYMGNWVCDEISGPDNQWLGNNIPRWCNPDYEDLVVQMSETAAFDDRVAMAKKMNDLLVQNCVMIPLIHRGDVSGVSNTIDMGGWDVVNSWDSEFWNIADWQRVEE
jgi:peptide/nickel transport system substrate-binding protein